MKIPLVNHVSNDTKILLVLVLFFQVLSHLLYGRKTCLHKDTYVVLLLRRSAFGIFLEKYHRLSLCSVGILSENRCSACGREKFVLRIVSGYIIELYSLWLPDNFSMPYLLQQTVVLGVCSGVGYG